MLGLKGGGGGYDVRRLHSGTDSLSKFSPYFMSFASPSSRPMPIRRALGASPRPVQQPTANNRQGSGESETGGSDVDVTAVGVGGRWRVWRGGAW